MKDRKEDALFIVTTQPPWAWISNANGDTKVRFDHITEASLSRIATLTFNPRYKTSTPFIVSPYTSLMIERVQEPEPKRDSIGLCYDEDVEIVNVQVVISEGSGTIGPRIVRVVRDGKPVRKEYSGPNEDRWVAYERMRDVLLHRIVVTEEACPDIETIRTLAYENWEERGDQHGTNEG